MTSQAALGASGATPTNVTNQSGALQIPNVTGVTSPDATGGTAQSGVSPGIDSTGLGTVSLPGNLNVGDINFGSPALSTLSGGLRGAQTAGSLYNIYGGLTSGNPLGQAGGALGLASLGNRLAGNGVSPLLSGAGGLLSVAGGLERGGVSGYGGAVVGGLQAASQGAELAGAGTLAGEGGATASTGLAGGLSGAAGYIAAPLSVYNAVSNWQQGNTLGNTINSAEAGAAIGSIVPGVGTAIGAIVGGIVGLGTSLIQGKHTEDNITAVDPGQSVIKLQSGNSALQQGGVAYGAGSSNKQGSAQWFLVPQASGALQRTTGTNAGSIGAAEGGQPNVTKGTPFWIGTQASQELTNFANSVPLTNGQPNFSSYLAQYQKNPDANSGLIGVYNNNGGQEGWGQSFGEWLQSIWGVKHNVTGNLTTS